MIMMTAGRPPKPPGERRSAPIQVRVREDEKALFQKAAEAEGKSLSAWMVENLTNAAKFSLKKRR